MAKISFRPTFIKEVLTLFKERSLKDMLFGKRVELDEEGKKLFRWIKEHQQEFKESGGRSGSFIAVNLTHRGSGTAYLLPRITGNSNKESILLFGEDFKVIPGPDLWIYLSPSEDIRKNLGEYIHLGLLKGTRGGQWYRIEKPISELTQYRSAVVYCKQFSALFTFAVLK